MSRKATRLLLDTHVVLWALIDPGQLDATCRGMIEDGANEVYVSAVSAWEIEIKRALGKLDAPDDLEEQLQAARLVELPLRVAHVRVLRRLPPLHRDPFDRMLLAQAAAEQLTLVTRDGRLGAYGVAVLLA